MDEIWIEVENATKDFDFEPIRQKLLSLPDEQGKAFEPIKNVRALAHSYLNAQKMIGDPYARLPKPEDTEGYRKVQARYGLPEKPEDYKFNLGEYQLPDETLGEIRKNLYDATLTNGQAEKVLKSFLDLTKRDLDAKAAEKAKLDEENKTKKTTKFGEKLSEVENLAKSYIEKIGNERVRNQLSGLLEDADGLELLSNIATVYQGDKPDAGAKLSVKTYASARDQIEALKRDQAFLNKLLGTDARVPHAERVAAKKLWEDLHYSAAKE